MHTARMWMASAIPGGAPGYDDDKEFGNNITHLAAQTSQRLRGTYNHAPKVKARRKIARFGQFSEVPGVRRGQITPRSHTWPSNLSFRDGPKDQTSDAQLHIGESRDSGSRYARPGMTPSSHPRAASGFTHSNSGN
jgi:hypothetical protein